MKRILLAAGLLILSPAAGRAATLDLDLPANGGAGPRDPGRSGRAQRFLTLSEPPEPAVDPSPSLALLNKQTEA
ncbi:hypothetical protein GAY28_11795, partial [Azospirillum brasilense]|nr:hypothetical protein [Azospirillum brasilense]